MAAVGVNGQRSSFGIVTVAIAAIAYGQPRMTNDVDVVVRRRGEGSVGERSGTPPPARRRPPA